MTLRTLLLTSAVVCSAIVTVSAASYSPDRHPVIELTLPAATASQSANLFKNATVTASGSYGNDRAELAVDGEATNANRYWGCENLPVWHCVDMGSEKTLSSIHIWPYWSDGRIYQYKIEGSEDGKNWKTLVDQSANSISGTAEGNIFTFDPVKVRYVRTVITGSSAGNKAGGHIVEIQGFAEPVKTQVQAVAVTSDKRMPGDQRPVAADSLTQGIELTAWRGERVNGQIAVFGDQDMKQVNISVENLRGPVDSLTVPMTASFVRFTGARGKAVPDIIDPSLKRMDLPTGQTRSVWVQADIPQKTPVGLYRGAVVINAQGCEPVRIPVTVNVQQAVLPSPDQWGLHLDLWQHPESVARWHDVEPWSPEHFALMKPLMKRLANAGQKAITCSLLHEAWNEQTYDWWPSMIQWIRKPDGSMTYDYANFDKWVTFMSDEVGLKNAQITCYTMVPWSMKLRYFDQASNEYKEIPLNPGQPEYEKIWGGFLTDFVKHLKAKGWLERTCIGLDERPDRMVRACQEVIDRYAPELRMVSAFNFPTKITDRVYDLSIVLGHVETAQKALERRKQEGKKTTFYVCCSPAKPNTFTTSPLAESEWLGLFAAANHMDGFLRWAYNSWNRNPMEKTDFGNWAPGDCYLVYPGNRTSLRFEKLRDGFEAYEKVSILRRAAASAQASSALKEAVRQMDEGLKKHFTVERSRGTEHVQDVEMARKLIDQASKQL